MAARIGGSLAPALTDDVLSQYSMMIERLPEGPIKDALQTLVGCVHEWWSLPESDEVGSPHPSGRGVIVPLTAEVKDAIYELIPWSHELDAIQGLFDTIPATDHVLRKCAFHLLWYVRELNLDREPITLESVTGV